MRGEEVKAEETMQKVLLSVLTFGVAASSAAAAEPVALTGSTPAGLTEPVRMDAVTRILLEFGAAPEPTHATAFPAQAAAPIALGFLGAAEAGGSGTSERLQLSAFAMDMVTAGLVSVDVTAFAAAQGADAFTGTDTDTHAASGKWIEVAYGSGEAYAFGDEAAVDVATSVYGDGDYVLGGTSRTVAGAPGSAWGYTTGFVVSIDAGHPRFDAVKGKYERLANHLELGTERQVASLQRAYDTLVRRADRGSGHLDSLLAQKVEGLVRFVDLGYDRLLSMAIAEYDRIVRDLERGSGD